MKMILVLFFTFFGLAHAQSGPVVSGYGGMMKPNEVATIANGGTISTVINTGGMALEGIIIPAAFTSTAISFLMSNTLAGTYVQVKSTITGSVLTYTVAPGGYYAIDPKDFQGIQFLKITSGSAEAGARTIVYSLKGR